MGGRDNTHNKRESYVVVVAYSQQWSKNMSIEMYQIEGREKKLCKGFYCNMNKKKKKEKEKQVSFALVFFFFNTLLNVDKIAKKNSFHFYRHVEAS